MARKWAAIGTQLWVGDGASPETFFKVASIQDLTGPKKKRDTIDTTTHDSDATQGGYKEFIGSLKDGGEVSLPLFLDPNETSQNNTATVAGVSAGGLNYLFETGDVRHMYIVYPVSPAARIPFSGLITGVDYDSKVAGALMASATIKVSGKPGFETGLTSGMQGLVTG